MEANRPATMEEYLALLSQLSVPRGPDVQTGTMGLGPVGMPETGGWHAGLGPVADQSPFLNEPYGNPAYGVPARLDVPDKANSDKLNRIVKELQNAATDKGGGEIRNVDLSDNADDLLYDAAGPMAPMHLPPEDQLGGGPPRRDGYREGNQSGAPTREEIVMQQFVAAPDPKNVYMKPKPFDFGLPTIPSAPVTPFRADGYTPPSPSFAGKDWSPDEDIELPAERPNPVNEREEADADRISTGNPFGIAGGAIDGAEPTAGQPFRIDGSAIDDAIDAPYLMGEGELIGGKKKTGTPYVREGGSTGPISPDAGLSDDATAARESLSGTKIGDKLNGWVQETFGLDDDTMETIGPALMRAGAAMMQNTGNFGEALGAGIDAGMSTHYGLQDRERAIDKDELEMEIDKARFELAKEAAARARQGDGDSERLKVVELIQQGWTPENIAATFGYNVDGIDADTVPMDAKKAAEQARKDMLWDMYVAGDITKDQYNKEVYGVDYPPSNNNSWVAG